MIIERQSSTILKNAPVPIILTDSNECIISWNPAAEKVFGWNEVEVTGKFLYEVLKPHPYRKKSLAATNLFFKAFNLTQNTVIKFLGQRKDNTEITLEVSVSHTTLNESDYFICYLRDVTKEAEHEKEILNLNSKLEHQVVERTRQLHESEKKYRHLFEDNPMPMWVIELPSLRFLDVNESAVRLYGYSREEFLSKTSLDIRPPEEKQRYLELDRSKQETKNTGVWKHLRKDGTLIFAEVIVHGVIFEGKPARLILSNDVTERKKAEDALRLSEARFRKIFNSRLIGLTVWNDTHGIVEANDVFLEMMDYSRKDLQEGKIMWNNLTPDDYSKLDRMARDQIRLTGVCDPFEKEYFRKDGTRVPVLVAAASIEDDMFVSYIMDITDQKEMKERIFELNKSLEQRVEQRTRELQIVNKELEAFSYSVSHDLRAPLRAIHGYSQILIEDYEKKLDEEGVRLLNNVKSNAKMMGQLVDDLLTFSRMGKCAVNPTEIDMNNIVSNVLTGMAKYEISNIEIKVHPLGVGRADPSLIQIVFQNLLSNAIKYSSKNKTPVVEVGATVENEVKAYFVKDNGAGFDMKYYNKLFGVFQRLHGQNEFEGTGVGLAIVKRIVSRHGGQIWAKAAVNDGATFYFTLDTINANEFDESY